jgi:hypothetical protein
MARAKRSLMSGYREGLRETEPIGDQDIGFVDKPFTAYRLLQQVHVLLTYREAATPAGAR